jgi:nucleotide-binding universal stress UspA family protein
MLILDDILVARDFSPVSDRAARVALDLAERAGAALHLLFAEVLHDNPFADAKRYDEGQAERIRTKLREGADGKPLFDPSRMARVEEHVVRDVAAAPAITTFASERDLDLIVLGTAGRRGVARMFLGSVAEEVVRTAERPVLTIPRKRDGDDRPDDATLAPRRILVPIDFSDHCRHALRYARAWAALYEADLDVVHVMEKDLHPAFYLAGGGEAEVGPELRKRAHAELETFVQETPGPDVPHRLRIEAGRAARALLTCGGEAGIDLIVMATHGLTGMEHFLMGSVAEKVVRRATCPVLTVKPFGKSLLPDEARAGTVSA